MGKRVVLLFLFVYWTHRNPLELVGVLDQAGLLSKAVNRVVGASLLAQEAADGEGGGLSGVDSLLVNVGEVDLHGSVILGGDQAVGGRAGGKKKRKREFQIEVSFQST